MNQQLREQILTIVARVPPGRVTSYGRIAKLTDGASARMVGAALRALPEGHGLPWQRVVDAAGRIVDHPGADRQRRLLRDEGITLDTCGRVPADYFWP